MPGISLPVTLVNLTADCTVTLTLVQGQRADRLASAIRPEKSQNMFVLRPEMDSTGPNWPRNPSLGVSDGSIEVFIMAKHGLVKKLMTNITTRVKS